MRGFRAIVKIGLSDQFTCVRVWTLSNVVSVTLTDSTRTFRRCRREAAFAVMRAISSGSGSMHSDSWPSSSVWNEMQVRCCPGRAARAAARTSRTQAGRSSSSTGAQLAVCGIYKRNSRRRRFIPSSPSVECLVRWTLMRGAEGKPLAGSGRAKGPFRSAGCSGNSPLPDGTCPVRATA